MSAHRDRAWRDLVTSGIWRSFIDAKVIPRAGRRLDQSLHKCRDLSLEPRTLCNGFPTHDGHAHCRQAIAQCLQSTPPTLGPGDGGCNGDDFLFELTRADHPFDAVLQYARQTESVPGHAIRTASLAVRASLHCVTLSGTPLASISGLKCGKSRRPSKRTRSTPGGIDAAAVFKSARFPDLACRLPQIPRTFMSPTFKRINRNCREVFRGRSHCDPGF